MGEPRSGSGWTGNLNRLNLRRKGFLGPNFDWRVMALTSLLRRKFMPRRDDIATSKSKQQAYGYTIARKLKDLSLPRGNKDCSRLAENYRHIAILMHRPTTII